MKVMRLMILALVLCTTPAWAANILIYGPSLYSGTPNEQTTLEAAGHTVTVADAATWASMTSAQFAAYDVIVFGDNGCDSDSTVFATAEANQAVWAPVVDGNMVVHYFDPYAHVTAGEEQEELVVVAVEFAASAGGGRTGLYFAGGCYDFASDTIEVLSAFGTFTVNDAASGDTIDIVNPTHPVTATLTEAGLSNWGNSTHGAITAYPAGFELLANEVESGDLPVLLAFTAPPQTVPGIPSLSEWGLIAMASFLAMAGALALRLR